MTNKKDITSTKSSEKIKPAEETKISVDVQKMIDQLAEKADHALHEYMKLDQEQVNKIVNAMALAGSGLTYAAAGISSGVGSSSNTGINSNNAMYFELPVYLDGKVVAKTTARYMNNELSILYKKESRKRGNR